MAAPLPHDIMTETISSSLGSPDVLEAFTRYGEDPCGNSMRRAVCTSRFSTLFAGGAAICFYRLPTLLTKIARSRHVLMECKYRAFRINDGKWVKNSGNTHSDKQGVWGTLLLTPEERQAPMVAAMGR